MLFTADHEDARRALQKFIAALRIYQHKIQRYEDVCMGPLADRLRSRFGLKLRRTQHEHMFYALLSNSDIARCIRHASNVPEADERQCSKIQPHRTGL